MKATRILTLLLASLAACGSDEPPPSAPPPPEPEKIDDPVTAYGFKTSVLRILVCPENLTFMRLASDVEVEAVRERIAKSEILHRDGTPVTEDFDGLLIREDGRVAYMIQGPIAVTAIEKGLKLDPSVGPPR